MSSQEERQRDERRTRSEADLIRDQTCNTTSLTLRPISKPVQLIAPNFAGQAPLPGLKDLGLLPTFDNTLLEKGRGVCVPPPLRSKSDPGTNLTFQGRVLAEYPIRDVQKNAEGKWEKLATDRIMVMQQPTANENHAEFTRQDQHGNEITYILDCAQPPKQARACGNGPRSSADRRPIDPPPVVKLSIFHGKTDITGHYEASFMLYASLEFARPIANNNIYATNHCPVLTGTNSAGAAYLTKPSNAAYFIFPDLSIRHEGFYRLKFHLFEQNKSNGGLNIPPTSGSANSVCTKPSELESMVNRSYVYSPPFQVFSAKKFPGLEESTPLSMVMAEQGCRVRIRREVRQRRANSKSGHKDDDQRSLRAASRDHGDGVDTADEYTRDQYALESRRPSIDSQRSRPSSWLTGRQDSAVHTPTLSQSAEPRSMWSSNYHSGNMPVAHPLPSPSTLHRPVMAPFTRPTLPPISPTTGSLEHSRLPMPGLVPARTQLPPLIAPNSSQLASLLAPTEPQRPAGGYYDTEPVNKKRALNRSSEERTTGLKDHARPVLEPSSRSKMHLHNSILHTTSHAPLAAAGQMIEADPNEDSSDENGSDEECMTVTSFRRANGQRKTIN